MTKDIFELEIITYDWDMDFTNPYPSFNISDARRYFFQTFEEAIFQVKACAKKNGQEKIYRFILRQLPLNETLYSGDFIKLYIFDSSGNLLDESLCSNCARVGRKNEFKGRPENMVRFHKGDIVEWFDNEKARLGIITGTPLPPQDCQEIMERYNKLRQKSSREWLLDWSDDSYLIIHNPDYIGSHEHVFSPYVSKPTFEVPEELRNYLENAWQKVKDEK